VLAPCTRFLFGSLGIIAHGNADTRITRRNGRFSLSGAADKYPSTVLGIFGHRLDSWMHKVRVVIELVIRKRAVVFDVMASFSKKDLEILFEREAGVICRNMYNH
jgi:hypothetical protein